MRSERKLGELVGRDGEGWRGIGSDMEGDDREKCASIRTGGYWWKVVGSGNRSKAVGSEWE
eukprot:286297-Rhodomonas_salina.1